MNKSGKNSSPYSFFGYSIDPNDRHKLIIDEPAAETVRLIFNLREQGVTTPKIASKLNNDGIQTANERQREKGAKRDWLRNGKINMWETAFISRILRDERYTGKHIYGRTKRVELGKRAVKTVPRSEWIVVPDAIPAIITEEQFARVRELLSAKTPSKPRKSFGADLPFYHKIFCGTCGKALARVPSGGGYIYYCPTHNRVDGLECMRGSIRESEVIETVLTVLRQQAQFAEDVKSFRSLDAKTSSATAENLRCEIQNLQRLIDKASSTKLSLWEKQHNGNLSGEAYQSESKKLTGQVASYTTAITELESQIRKLEMDSGQENTFVERFSRQAGINELSREVVDEFIKAIHVHTPDRIEITLNYADEYEKIVEKAGAVR